MEEGAASQGPDPPGSVSQALGFSRARAHNCRGLPARTTHRAGNPGAGEEHLCARQHQRDLSRVSTCGWGRGRMGPTPSGA